MNLANPLEMIEIALLLLSTQLLYAPSNYLPTYLTFYLSSSPSSRNHAFQDCGRLWVIIVTSNGWWTRRNLFPGKVEKDMGCKMQKRGLAAGSSKTRLKLSVSAGVKDSSVGTAKSQNRPESKQGLR